MKLWRRNKKTEKELQCPVFLKAGLIKFNQRLHRIADFLEHRTNQYSRRKKKNLLLLFTIVLVTESTVVIIRSVTHKNETLISFGEIKTVPLQNEENKNSLISKKTFYRVQRFKNYIDSLNTSSKGKKLRDSLLHNRPLLMDSVNLLIHLFLEQSKTKQNEK